MTPRNPIFHKTLRALTLVELLLALVILGILSTVVVAMINGAARTSLYVTNGTDTVSEVEVAYRRILHNIRTCSAITAPTNTTATNSITLKTQPDAANSNAIYTVTYSLSNGSLLETDSRYASANTLVTGVTAFSVTRNTLTSPQTVTISITAGVSPSISRSITIYCRNL